MCEHFWIERKDGFEEMCTPAICLLCGEYGCICNLTDSTKFLRLAVKMRERRKGLFYSLAIDGNKHEIEKELRR